MYINSSFFKILYCIGFILVFLKSFVIYFSSNHNGANIYVGSIVWILLYLGCILFCTKDFFEFLKNIFKIKLVRYYSYFILFITLTSLVHYFLGTFRATWSYYLVRYYKYYIGIVMVAFLPLLGCFFNIKLKTIIKLVYGFIYITFVIGIIQYISYLLNLNFVSLIIDFFTNARDSQYILKDECQNALRVFSLFREPSALGNFVFCYLPIILLSTYNYKIYDNNIVNNLVKKTMIPLMLLNIIFTKSPIYLVLCFVEFVILLLVRYKNYIKNMFPKLVLLLLVSFICLSIYFLIFSATTNLDLSETYLNRIFLSLNCLGDLEMLTQVEASLAQRILCYVIQIQVFTKNILFGCGLFNAGSVSHSFIMQSQLPMTYELLSGYLKHTTYMDLNRGLFYTFLAEIGLIGTLLYTFFLYKCVNTIKKCSNFFIGIEKSFCLSLAQSLITTFIISFYNTTDENIIIWLFYGICFFVVINIKKSPM